MTDLTCPFCHETDFDLIGLKSHFGWCDAFDAVQAVSNPMIEPRASPTVTVDQVNAAAKAIAKRYAVGKGGVAVIGAIITRHLADGVFPQGDRYRAGLLHAARICRDKADSLRLGAEDGIAPAYAEDIELCERLAIVIASIRPPEAAATVSPETPVGGETRICLTCGHEERFSDNEGGTCEKIVDEESNFCGCVCRFAAPVPAAGDDEGGVTCFTYRSTSLKLQGRCDHGEPLTASCGRCQAFYNLLQREKKDNNRQL